MGLWVCFYSLPFLFVRSSLAGFVVVCSVLFVSLFVWIAYDFSLVVYYGMPLVSELSYVSHFLSFSRYPFVLLFVS